MAFFSPIVDRKPIVVLTFIGRIPEGKLSEYKIRAKDITGTDQVICIENYTADNYDKNPETEETVVDLLEKCFFAGDRLVIAERNIEGSLSRAKQLSMRE